MQIETHFGYEDGDQIDKQEMIIRTKEAGTRIARAALEAAQREMRQMFAEDHPVFFGWYQSYDLDMDGKLTVLFHKRKRDGRDVPSMS